MSAEPIEARRVSPLVAALAVLESIDLGIDPDDDMLEGARRELGGDLEQALVAYVRSGIEVSGTWRRLLAQLPATSRVLDFASGYGRVTRFLLPALGRERLTVADVDAAAMAFQQRHFGVESLVVPSSPAGFAPARRFDLILVTSLFTHLPEDLTRAWLERLLGLLEDRGVLALTFHDPRLLAPERFAPAGFWFEPVSESRVLDAATYGSTWIDPARLAGWMHELRPQARIDVFPRIFGERQDLALVDLDPSRRLAVAHPPFAFLEGAEELGDGRFALQGWGLDFGTSQPLAALELRAGGVAVESAVERFAHAAVAERFGLAASLPVGFRLTARLGPITAATPPLALFGTTADGVRGLLETRTREGFLLRQAASTERLLRDEIRFWRGRFEEVETAHVARGVELARAEATLAAARASFFWRLRSRWFALKRTLGLPAAE